MSKFDDAIITYKSEMDKLGLKYDETLLVAVAKGLGPSIYNADSSKVSGTDTAELNTVKQNFLIKKLGLTEKDDLDGAIAKVIEQVGSSNKNKYRAIFYYLLTKHFKKESVYNK